jgi:hypothetical protein
VGKAKNKYLKMPTTIGETTMYTPEAEFLDVLVIGTKATSTNRIYPHPLEQKWFETGL